MNTFRFKLKSANASTYTTTNTSRSAEIEPAEDQNAMLENLSVADGTFVNNRGNTFVVPAGDFKIPSGCKLHVNKIRAVCEGIPGARVYDHKAFDGYLVASDGTDDGIPVHIVIPSYEKEYNADFIIVPTNSSDEKLSEDWGIIYGDGSKFSLDDFALSESFVDVGCNPYLEIEGTIEE